MKAKLRVGPNNEAVEDAALVNIEDSGLVNIEESTNESIREDNEHEEVKEEAKGEEDVNEGANDAKKKGDGKEKVKLAEGFFEMEAIRRKRIRKGQLQYLIKWRDWPENANTWEPLENLQSCSDVIDAFEERLHSGKALRKRKRKHGIFQRQHMKKQGSPYTTHKLPGLKAINLALKTRHGRSTNKSSLPELSGAHFMGSSHLEDNGSSRSTRSLNQGDHNSTLVFKSNFEEKGMNEYDPKLSELREPPMNNGGGHANELGIHFQDQGVRNNESPVGFPKEAIEETVPNDRRIGAKRRKSGSVKRFQKDLSFEGSTFLQQVETLNSDGKNILTNNTGDESEGVAIIKIVKTIGMKAIVVDDSQDVELTFSVIRADGQETVVDNSFLKANYPLLLLNFYEQYVKYGS